MGKYIQTLETYFCHHIETNRLIPKANQSACLHMMEALA